MLSLSERSAPESLPLPQEQASTYRNFTPLRLLPFAVHVIPQALIQIFDFASDVLVIIYMRDYDGSPFVGAWIVGIIAIVLSGITSWFCIFSDKRLLYEECVILAILTPLNLHVVGCGILWMITTEAKDPRSDDIYKVFYILKVVESALEAVPFAIMAMGAIATDTTMYKNTEMTLYASLVLSLLSISYGMSGKVTAVYRDNLAGTGGQLFLCLLIHVSSVLVTLGVCLGTMSLGAIRFIPPVAMVALTVIQVVTLMWDSAQDTSSQVIALLWLAILSAPIVVPFAIIASVTDYTILIQGQDRTMDLVIIPILHRAIIVATDIAIVVTEPFATTAVMLLTLFLTDIFVSTPRIFYLIGKWDQDLFALFCTRERLSAKILNKMIRESQNYELIAERDENVELAITGGYIYVYDVLEYIILYVNSALIVPGHMDRLKSHCEKLIRNLGALSAKDLECIRVSLDSYVPSKDGEGEAERTLFQSLQSLANTSVESDQLMTEYTQPMRSVHLANALQKSMWSTVPSFFGKISLHTPYHLSQDCKRCDWFISHSWSDNGGRKLQLLREYLCLQDLLGIWLITFLLLAGFVFPLGFAIKSRFESFPFWIPSMFIISLLVIVLLWVLFSLIQIVPSRFAPWAFSQQTLWLDKCCIDQSSPEAKKAGIYAFDRFLDSCDGMVAFVSKSYFSRVWCVFELATFCKAKTRHPNRKLLLYSLEWPSSINPFKSAVITEEEKSWLQKFSCRSAQCYKPADRGFVLETIRREWGSEQLFDQYVRTELPIVFTRSKIEYSRQLMDVAKRSLDLLFGA